MIDSIDTAKEREKLATLEGHTPGPWVAIRNSAFWEFGVYRDGAYSLGDVCSTAPGDPDAGGQEANAILIAAAPDLKETVAKLCDALDAKDAEIERLREAASAVEEWWLREGMHESVGGAPAAIFQLRSVLNPEGWA